MEINIKIRKSIQIRIQIRTRTIIKLNIGNTNKGKIRTKR